jgi:hypothetical protein
MRSHDFATATAEAGIGAGKDIFIQIRVYPAQEAITEEAKWLPEWKTIVLSSPGR